jgi:formate hydrogenlyase subunit 3/multisubunit Na+/H+ antiporter MnhD subunit
VLAGLIGLGVLGLLGFPPFSLFASELGIFTAGYATGSGVATSIALVLVLVITAALFTHTGRMLLGNPPRLATVDGPGAAAAPDGTPLSTIIALGSGLAVCAAGAVRWSEPTGAVEFREADDATDHGVLDESVAARRSPAAAKQPRRTRSATRE